MFWMCAAISSQGIQLRATILLAGLAHQLVLHFSFLFVSATFSLLCNRAKQRKKCQNLHVICGRLVVMLILVLVNRNVFPDNQDFHIGTICLFVVPLCHRRNVVHLTIRKLYSKVQKNRNLKVSLCSLLTFLNVKFVLVSTLPHWCSQPSVCAGLLPAVVCKSRPSQGQAEPLCNPLLPFSRFLHASSFGVLFSFSLTATPVFPICALLSGSSPPSVSPNGKQNSEEEEKKKTATTCCTQNYLQCRAPL